MAASSSNSPCAACKSLRRKCTQSNVAKLLNEIASEQREDAVSSLAYEAEARLRDPVYGCVGYISVLQRRLKQLQEDLFRAKTELSSFHAAAQQTIIQPNPYFHGLHPDIPATSSFPSSFQTEMLSRELYFGGFRHPREPELQSGKAQFAGDVNSGADRTPPLA